MPTAAEPPTSSPSSSSSDDVMLREAEKVDRIGNDLKRQIAVCRRAGRGSKATAAGLRAEVDHLSGLADGVAAMLQALGRKYRHHPTAMTRDGGAAAYGVRQFAESVAAAQAVVEDARAMLVDSRAVLKTLDAVAMATTHGDDDRGAYLQAEEDQNQQRQQLLKRKRLGSAGGDGAMVEVTEEDMQALSAAEARALADDARAVRGAAEQVARLTAEQQEALDAADGNLDDALDRTERGRKELSQAAKYKMGAMTLSAALVGGLVGGPIGAYAGAQSMAAVAACAAAGSATSVLATNRATRRIKETMAAEESAMLAANPVDRSATADRVERQRQRSSPPPAAESVD